LDFKLESLCHHLYCGPVNKSQPQHEPWTRELADTSSGPGLIPIAFTDVLNCLLNCRVALAQLNAIQDALIPVPVPGNRHV